MIATSALLVAAPMAAAPTSGSSHQLGQLLVSGFANGCIYALIAVSLLLVYSVTGIINFAVGDFLMAGAMLTLLFAGPNGYPHRLPLLLAVILAVIAVGAGGALIERLVIHPRRSQGSIILLIMTIGISQVLEGAALIPTKSKVFGLRPFTAGPGVSIGGVSVPRQDFWIVGVTLAAMVGLWLLLSHTRTGKAFRACEINPLAARLMGIRPTRYWMLAFALGAALAALAGATVVPVTYATYNIGLPLSLKGFVAWILGGTSSPVGAVVAGIVLGLVEALAQGYLPGALSNYGGAVPLIILVAALVIRRTGLSRTPAIGRV